MTLPLVVLAVPSAAVGWWLHRHHLLHAYLTGSAAGAELKMHVGVATMATLLGLAGAAAAWTWHCRRPTTTQTAARPAGALLALPVNLWFVDRFWTWIGARLAMGTARAIAWFDRHVVDGAVRGSARLVAGLGTAMCRSASGQTQTYAAVVIGGAVALMLLLALYETAAGPAARDIATTIVSAGTR
jgi:NADH-quinone oxidoreductase subunit L